MSERSGEKWGWTGGWAGGFLWLVICAVIVLVQGKLLEGTAGLALAGVAAVTIGFCAPWRHPETVYWKLMAPIYLLLLLALLWLGWGYASPDGLNLNAWSLFLLLPLAGPMIIAGQRTWKDGAKG